MTNKSKNTIKTLQEMMKHYKIHFIMNIVSAVLIMLFSFIVLSFDTV